MSSAPGLLLLQVATTDCILLWSQFTNILSLSLFSKYFCLMISPRTLLYLMVIITIWFSRVQALNRLGSRSYYYAQMSCESTDACLYVYRNNSPRTEPQPHSSIIIYYYRAGVNKCVSVDIEVFTIDRYLRRTALDSKQTRLVYRRI